MQLSPPPTVSRPWGHVWVEWVGSLYRYLAYRKKYLVATGSVSLTTGATSTVVTDTSCLSTSKVFLTLASSTAAITDASTAHALNAVFLDTQVEGALNALGTKINEIITAFSATNPYVSSVAIGSFTITHSNSASARTFSYLIVNE